MKFKILFVVAASMLLNIGCSSLNKGSEGDKFANLATPKNTEKASFWQISSAYFNAERVAPAPTLAIPVTTVTTEQLQEPSDALFRLGHASMAIRLNGQLIITDPMLSERASPVPWFGPKRFHQSPISAADIPTIDVVIISHDHYDHLDKATIRQLQHKVTLFLTPLKVGQKLLSWGVSQDKIIELDWWEERVINGIKYVATPAQHFSGRGMFDRNRSLWASWVIQSGQQNLYFSGDSGYFDGFKAIGEKYGPFDVTMVETGAYNEFWRDMHMFPEDSIQAHLDLQGTYMMPVHNGTFDLALHDWYEPFERLLVLSEQHNVNLLTPQFGQEVRLDNVPPTPLWWREAMLEKTWQ